METGMRDLLEVLHIIVMSEHSLLAAKDFLPCIWYCIKAQRSFRKTIMVLFTTTMVPSSVKTGQPLFRSFNCRRRVYLSKITRQFPSVTSHITQSNSSPVTVDLTTVHLRQKKLKNTILTKPELK